MLELVPLAATMEEKMTPDWMGSRSHPDSLLDFAYSQLPGTSQSPSSCHPQYQNPRFTASAPTIASTCSSSSSFSLFSSKLIRPTKPSNFEDATKLYCPFLLRSNWSTTASLARRPSSLRGVGARLTLSVRRMREKRSRHVSVSTRRWSERRLGPGGSS